jgi:hypothetical protein
MTAVTRESDNCQLLETLVFFVIWVVERVENGNKNPVRFLKSDTDKNGANFFIKYVTKSIAHLTRLE